MNVGAKAATGILYFLHCDSLPLGILTALSMILFKTGIKRCFRMKFDYRHPVLMISQWFTRFNHISCRGGDQSLFITNELFKELKGFDENFVIYEDNEIISRLYAKKQFVVIPDYIITGQKIPPEWDLASTIPFQYYSSKRRLGHSTESMLQYYKRTSNRCYFNTTFNLINAVII
jgi:hypothetical protein